MGDTYFEQRKEIIKRMVKEFKEEEYNNYCFDINKYIIALNGKSFSIGTIDCYVKDYQLYVKFDKFVDFRDFNMTINNVKHLAKELNDVCIEVGVFNEL